MMTNLKNLKTSKPSHWKCPKIWKGSTAYIIGGGPSLNLLDLSLIHKKRVIGCNDAYSLGSWIDVNYFGDWYWFLIHWKWKIIRDDGTTHPGFKAFKGLRVTNNDFVFQMVNAGKIKGIKCLKRFNKGLITIPGAVAWNTNTGASAINLAINLGAKKIVLLGFDMKWDEKGNSNWHSSLKPELNPKHYEEKFIPGIEEMIKPLNKIGVEVVNASPGSLLKLFKQVTLKETL